MRIDTIEITVVLTGAVSGMALWSNPKRATNRVFFSSSIHVAMWLLCLRAAILNHGGEGLFWLRTTCAVGGALPGHMWLIKEVVRAPDRHWSAFLKASLPWMAGTAVLCTLPFTHWFIPTRVTTNEAAQQVYGIGYYGYIVGIVVVYAMLCRETMRQMRTETGLRRLEMQILLLGGSGAAVTVMMMMGLRALLGIPWLVRLQPPVILLFYAVTGFAITTHRVFDARQLMLVGIQRLLLITLVAGFAYEVDVILRFAQVPDVLAFFAMIGLALWFAAVVARWLDRLFHFYREATEARQAAFAVARREQKIEGLEKGFLAVLKGWGQAEHALILAGGLGSLPGGTIELADDSPVAVAMRHLRWATPERLARERLTPERNAVAQFLDTHSLGAVVAGEGSTLKTIVGVGVPASRRPFTYPQVTQLMEIASIIEGALERAHISVKAQHAEQLATVGLLGASLAHEIRNPLVTIKTFVQLLPQHHQDETFREKFFGLIHEEVTRIDRLTEQLLDLASPRAYQAHEIELHPVLQSSIALVAAKATDKRMRFLTDFRAAPDRAFTDPSAARQVLLNLCFNAIQAIESIEGDGWVKVGTRLVPGGIEMSVEDNGPGVAKEIRPRLFQPFQSNKSSGFGLGLAICSDILAGLDATIGVDPATPGHGAIFRVVFPVSAPASL